MITVAKQLSPHVGKKTACEALKVPRATFYRHLSANIRPGENTTGRPAPPLALGYAERQAVINILQTERFCDYAPHQVYAKLLDAGRYMCSIRTMYRTQSCLVMGHYQT